MTYTHAPLYLDDTDADSGSRGLPHVPKGVINQHTDLLTRSIERPAVRAGVPCPHCQKGSMFLEDQMHDEPELVCKSCSYNEAPVDLPALLELAGELADASVPKKGKRATHRRHPSSNGEEL